jgi:hypothetical protein
MPHKHGIGTHLGYQTPPPGESLNEHERHVLSTVYGNCRANEYPGESPEAKEHCAKIAWGAVNRLR